MKYFWLTPRDQRFNNWIFYSESMESGVRLREEYLSLKCPKCNKIDELAAIDLGVSPGVRIRSRVDYLVSDDGIVCISAAGRRVLEEANIDGIRFVSLPGDSKYSLLLPQVFLPTDRERAGIEFLRQCPVCRRFRETCCLPVAASMQLPEKGKVLGCPDIENESTRGREFWFLASEEVVSLFRENKLSGIEYSLVS